jgi:hypothetical protein
VHYTTRGADDSTVEIDRVGDGGRKATEGAIKGIDRGGKVLVIGTKDGSEETFRLTERATKDGGWGVVEGANVTVSQSETAGKKMAHFSAAPLIQKRPQPVGKGTRGQPSGSRQFRACHTSHP